MNHSSKLIESKEGMVGTSNLHSQLEVQVTMETSDWLPKEWGWVSSLAGLSPQPVAALMLSPGSVRAELNRRTTCRCVENPQAGFQKCSSVEQSTESRGDIREESSRYGPQHTQECLISHRCSNVFVK